VRKLALENSTSPGISHPPGHTPTVRGVDGEVGEAMASLLFEQYFTLTVKSAQHQLVNLATNITQN